MFDAKSAEFRDLLQNVLIVLAASILVGLFWHYILKIYLKRRNRVRPAKTINEKIQGKVHTSSPFSTAPFYFHAQVTVLLNLGQSYYFSTGPPSERARGSLPEALKVQKAS